MLLQDGLPFHLTPSVPAQWEANFLDPESPEANVTAALVVAESSNLEGQGMTWLMVWGIWENLQSGCKDVYARNGFRHIAGLLPLTVC